MQAPTASWVARYTSTMCLDSYSDSNLSGHFYFIGPDLENLCKCIVDNFYHESDEPSQKEALHRGTSTRRELQR